MTNVEWLAEVRRRIAISEGIRFAKYSDSLGIPTIGVGFNLQRADADDLLRGCGSNLAACMAGVELTEQQTTRLFDLSFAPILTAARASLEPKHFDSLSDARRFVVCDLVYNLGEAGWLTFAGTRFVLDRACHMNLTRSPAAHATFNVVADRLAGSAWASQVGNRAARNIAMMRSKRLGPRPARYPPGGSARGSLCRLAHRRLPSRTNTRRSKSRCRRGPKQSGPIGSTNNVVGAIPSRSNVEHVPLYEARSTALCCISETMPVPRQLPIRNTGRSVRPARVRVEEDMHASP